VLLTNVDEPGGLGERTYVYFIYSFYQSSPTVYTHSIFYVNYLSLKPIRLRVKSTCFWSKIHRSKSATKGMNLDRKELNPIRTFRSLINLVAPELLSAILRGWLKSN